jgi:hypothetical protein
MVVPLVVWLALHIESTVAPFVAILTVQFETALPVLTIFTLSQKPEPQSLVVVSVAVTEPELAVETACSASADVSEDSSAQPPAVSRANSAAIRTRFSFFISMFLFYNRNWRRRARVQTPTSKPGVTRLALLLPASQTAGRNVAGVG